jgi:hypothetical protein
MKKKIIILLIITFGVLIFFAPIIPFESSVICKEPCINQHKTYVTSSVFKIIMHKIQPDNYKWMVNYIN